MLNVFLENDVESGSNKTLLRGYQWDDTTEKWILNKGEANDPTCNLDSDKIELDINVKPQHKKELEFYLEVDNKLCKLEYDRTEDPLEVTMSLIAENNLNSSYVADIFSYVVKHWIGFSKVSHLTFKLPPSPNEYFPLDKYYTYMNANVDGLKKKLIEFTNRVPEAQHIPEDNIEKLILVTDFPAEVSDEQMQALDTVLTWNDEYLFPALDLLRLAVKCQPIGAKVGNQSFLNHLLHVLRTSKKIINHVLLIKILCNLFDFAEGEELMLKYQLKICDTVKEALSSEKTHKSISSLYLNYAVAVAKGSNLDIDALCLNLIEMLKIAADPDSLYKIFIAIGTLSVTKYAAFANFHSLNVSGFLMECKMHVKGDSNNIVLEKLLKSFQL
ncbi:hypothetical protein JTE90_010854 [Oedothorax gibbosus]|uniref:PUL domain-containing protein n=1 Tax=Oedothorax gibbosus TaxID=931172 RepID=A0AAV6V5N6_9ARAC|nr:hypothetical protein JTE90_010854 [Oedothorax gibbosus]